ncbi:MAG TPA: CDGSH iron-sulfur domain-containing protein [Actinomycetota bacterium]
MSGSTGTPVVLHGCVLDGEDLEITTYPGGPTLVRGATSLRGPDGTRVPVLRRVTAICRCGKSRLLPRCDGTHRFVPGFEPADPHGGLREADAEPMRRQTKEGMPTD